MAHNFQNTVRMKSVSSIQFIVTFFAGLTFVVGIQLLQFGLIYPMVFDNGSKKQVERDKCNCACWDTWFKGYYENWPGSYHHVYFNSTPQTGFIWTITVFYVLIVYESVRHVIMQIWRRNIRLLYLLLFVIGLYSHQYTWWAFFGYFNDDFYGQVFHQTVFSVTEIYASWIVLMLATTRSPFSPKNEYIYRQDLDAEISRLSMLTAISLAHLAVGSLDQFIEQNVFGIGHFSQQSRNAGFILPDALGVLFPVRDLFVLLPYILELDDSQPAKPSAAHNAFPDGHASMLLTSCKLVSGMFLSPHFHRAVLVFFVVVFIGTVL